MNSAPGSNRETGRFEQLLALWREQSLSVEDRAELARLLKEPERRAELVSEWLLDEAVYHTLRARPPAAEEREKPALEVSNRATPRRAPVRRRTPRWLVWHEVRISIGWSFGFAAAACLLAGGLFFYFQTAAAGRLAEVRGAVTIERGRATVPGQSGGLVYPGDRVRLAAGGAAAVEWNGEPTRIELAGGTELELRGRLLGKRIWLRNGALEAEVAPQPRWRPMVIGTPQAEVRVVGTHFSLSASPTLTRLDVMVGEVRLIKTLLRRGEQGSQVTVRGGQTVSASPGVKLQVQYLTGLLSSDVWAVPPGTALSEAPARGTRLAQRSVADTGASVERLRGYLLAPETGDFTFWIGSFAGDQAVEFWMSPDEEPARRRRLSYYAPGSSVGPAARAGTAGRETAQRRALVADWSRSPSQKSAPQRLVEGRRYYLEIWHAGAGIHSIGLGWRRPGGAENAVPEPVDIQALCPYFDGLEPGAR